jgi:Uma2 family endonuclease
MTAALRKTMTLAEFLAWEAGQELRYEFDGFQPVAMTGGTVAHNRIALRLLRMLQDRLAGTPCEAFGMDVKIIVAGKVRYPDVLVTCSPQADSATIVENPIIVFEVLSDGTSRIDRIAKLREYQATPSIRRYVILEQDSIAATIFDRHDEPWRSFTLIEGDTLLLPEIGIQLPLAGIYADTALADWKPAF